MTAPVINRRHLVTGGAVALGVAALSAGIVEAMAAEKLCMGPVPPAKFDPVAFLADLKAAGCCMHLSRSATVFRPEDDRPTHFIAPSRGYTAVMAKWQEAMEACPGAKERVVARLVELNGWAT